MQTPPGTWHRNSGNTARPRRWGDWV